VSTEPLYEKSGEYLLQRDGNAATPFAQVRNLARVRVIVE
jgi:hypothetical protein